MLGTIKGSHVKKRKEKKRKITSMFALMDFEHVPPILWVTTIWMNVFLIERNIDPFMLKLK